MKQILYQSTSVLTLACMIALYYYLTIGKQPEQARNLVQAPKAAVIQECNCNDLSYLNGLLFQAPMVQPPLRADDIEPILFNSYTRINKDTSQVLAVVNKKSSQAGTMAWNSEPYQAKK